MDKNLEKIKSEYNNIPVPEEALSRIQIGIEKAKSENSNLVAFRPLRRVAIGFAAVFGVCIIAVNSSSAAAQTLGEIPVIGNLFRVLTVREYDENIGNAGLSVKEPSVSTNEGATSATDEVNADIEDYIAELIDVFKADAEADNISFSDLTVSYNVLTDNADYFSLDIAGVETGASGYEFHRFYTIDKAADKVLTLADIYGDTDYVSFINEEIIRQMNDQMANDSAVTYYIGTDEFGEDGFVSIDENQNFYINEDGDVVICFNEYEVAPGSAGAPEFVLPLRGR